MIDVPLSVKLSTNNWSILLLESTTIAELAVSVPAVWSSIFTYSSPPIISFALPSPINNLLELNEYANSPCPRADDGAAVLVLLFIFIVCAIVFPY